MERILLIDDDALEHKMFNCYLAAGRTDPYEMFNARTVSQAVEILSCQAIDIVFLDDRLAPHKSALEMLPMLEGYLSRSAVVIISSATEARHLQSAQYLGVTAILDKFEMKHYLQGSFEGWTRPKAA